MDESCALVSASERGDVDAVSELLESGAPVDATDVAGWTALMWAVYRGHFDVSKLLMKKGASVNVFDYNHMTPLIFSCGRGFLEISLLLLAHEAKPDTPDKYGTTPLIWACRKGYQEIAQKLLKAGANVDAIGMYGWTPLLVAVRGNFENLVELLISYKPNANACDSDGFSALMIASKGGYINMVNALLRINSYVNLSDRNGDTSLIHSSKVGHVLVVEALIKAHANVDHQGADKKSALYWAVEKGHVEVIRALLKASANVELATQDGDTPLIKAVRSRRLPIVKMLIDKKAKVTAFDKYGDTALHIAVRAQSKTIAEFLLRNPRNSQLLYKPNKRGETPFMLDNTHQKPILPTLFGATPSSRRVLEKETQLGYDLYSSAIANLLSEPTLKLPICVGLFAKWGSGKSFLIGKLKDDLLNFTQDWSIHPTFRFSWALFWVVLMLSLITGIATFGITNGKQYFWGIITGIGSFILSYLILAVIYCGHLRYDWSISSNLRARSDQAKTILQICFGNPPTLDPEQVLTLPVRFLFTETPVKISSDYNVTQLITAILSSLWQSMENELGFLPVRLFRVFQPKHVSRLTWRWRRICCMIPTIIVVVLSFFTLGILAILYYVDQAEPFKFHPVLTYILVVIISMTGAWILSNLLIPFKIFKEIFYSAKKKSREELKKDVQLMQFCIMCLDAFIGKRQSRLVIILDALESIYESERLVSLLEGVNEYFINFQVISANKIVSPPFVVILTLDPHHHITPKSKEYLKTIVHLPFYLQNSQLRKVKIAQQTVFKSDYRSSTTSLVEAITAAPFPPQSHSKGGPSSGFNRSKSKKIGNLKAADSVISLSGHAGESLTKVLLTDDYFSDVNPKSMRRIMNIVYIQGRLLKAFNLDFDWHRLTVWVNITEQWPLRASALITYWEIFENKYTDDSIPLKSIYDRVSSSLPPDQSLLSRDNDEKKLNIFLSYHHNSLTLGDLKTFAPFTINLDPYLRKNLTEAWTDLNILLPQPDGQRSATPSSNLNKNKPLSPSNYLTSHKLQLLQLNVEGVVALLKQIEAFDHSKIDRYAEAIRANNINGRVLVSCFPEDLNELKSVLGFTFGDWLLFKSTLLEGNLPNPQSTFQFTTGIYTSHATLGSNSEQSSEILRHKTNLEKQVTMEEAALASAVEMDSPIEEETSFDVETTSAPQEVGVLYIGNSVTSTRLSPSVSFGEADIANARKNHHCVDIEPEPTDTTPLVSPSKQSVHSSSSSSSSKRYPLERQGIVEPTESIV